MKIYLFFLKNILFIRIPIIIRVAPFTILGAKYKYFSSNTSSITKINLEAINPVFFF